MHSASFPLSTGRHRTGYSPNVKRTYTLWSAVQVTAQKPWHPSHIKNTHKHRPIGVAEDHTSHRAPVWTGAYFLPVIFSFPVLPNSEYMSSRTGANAPPIAISTGDKEVCPRIMDEIIGNRTVLSFFFVLLLGPVTFTLRRSSLPLSFFARQTKPSVPCLRPLPYTFLLKSNSRLRFSLFSFPFSLLCWIPATTM